MEYPEHDKLKLVAERTQFVSDFLEFCEEKEIFLTKDGNYKHYGDLLYEFTGIDRWKLEDEKVAMLDELRKASEPETCRNCDSPIVDGECSL